MLCRWCGQTGHDMGASCEKMGRRKGSQDAPGQGDWVWYYPPNRWEQYQHQKPDEYAERLKANEQPADPRPIGLMGAKDLLRAIGEQRGAEVLRENWGAVQRGRRIYNGSKRK